MPSPLSLIISRYARDLDRPDRLLLLVRRSELSLARKLSAGCFSERD